MRPSTNSVIVCIVCVILSITATRVHSKDEGSIPAGVSSRMSSEGLIFVTARGMSLYTRSDDRPGESRCLDVLPKKVTMQGNFIQVLPEPEIYRSCEQQWPPLRPVVGVVAAVGDWSIIKRGDGTVQWAYEKKPIYTSVYDRFPGEITTASGPLGRFRGVVQAAKAPFQLPGDIAVAKISVGVGLSSPEGILYNLARDNVSGRSSCSGECLLEWKILKAPSAATPFGEWSIIRREDGDSQWAFRGKPVYTRGLPRAEGLLHVSTSEERTKSDKGRPVVLFTIPPPPAGIAVRDVAFGPIYTTKDGMSLYIYSCTQEDSNRLACDHVGAPPVYMMPLCGGFDGDCSTKFSPFIAPAGAKPVEPLWTIVRINPRQPLRELRPGEEGVSVWAYYGRPLFTFRGDKAPGDYYGQGYAQEVGGWLTIKPFGSPSYPEG
jgi:predicted lipoprotein with Yx(FWY)xxD motif